MVGDGDKLVPNSDLECRSKIMVHLPSLLEKKKKQ